MFKSWFKKLKKKEPSPYILKEEKPEENSVKIVKRVYTQKGYYPSPYNKNYPKSGSLEHQYKPIETKTKSSEEKLVQKNDTKVEIIKEEIPSKLIEVPSKEIDFYETAKLCDLTVDLKEEIDERFEQIVESEHPIAETSEIINDATQTRDIPDEPVINAVEEKDGFIFVMNGYGVNVKVGNDTITAFIDTGIDVNIKPNQEVLLSHWNGIYDKKTGSVIEESGTERKGKSEEVLIQNV